MICDFVRGSFRPVKILLVYPRNPDSFWSFTHVLKLVSRKSAFPPLGLLTVAAMLPRHWSFRLVDLNVRPLADDDLRWADYVLLSGMIVHKASAREIAARCGAMVRASSSCATPAPPRSAARCARSCCTAVPA